jgi:hypothetical protein
MMRAYVLFGILGVGTVVGACSSSPETTAATGTTTTTTTATSGTGGAGGQSGATGTGGSGTGGATPMGDWSCLGKVTWPAPTAPMAEVNLSFSKLVGKGALEGLTVKVCDKADTPCAAPLSTGTTDAMGAVKLSVATGTSGFDGYLDVSGASIVPSLIYYLPPIVADIAAGSLDIPLVTTDSLSLITGLAGGITLDPTRGQLLALTYDCAAANAIGVKVAASTSDAKTTQAYLQGSALSTMATQTDKSGGSVLFNLPAGPTSASVTIAGKGTLTAKSSVNVRAGAFTYATLPPTPMP